MSKDVNYVSKLWVEGGANYARSLARGGDPYDVVSIVNIMFCSSLERCGFFRARVISSGERPMLGWSL